MRVRAAGRSRGRWRAAVRGALEHHGYTAVASLGRLWSRPLATVLTVAVIGIALALPAALHVALKNLRQLGDRWQGLSEISVFLDLEAGEGVALGLAEQLAARADVHSVRTISPLQALEDFRLQSGFDRALDALPANPLPWVLVIGPADRTPAGAGALRAALEGLPGVDFAQLDMEWLNRLDALLQIARRASALIGLLLVVAVLLIVGNTIRLELQARQGEVEVSKLLGATDGFVRRPFLYQALWYGVFGGLLAAGLTGAVLALAEGPVAMLAGAYQSDFRILGLSPTETLGLVGGGAAVGWLGSWLAVGRQLAEIRPG